MLSFKQKSICVKAERKKEKKNNSNEFEKSKQTLSVQNCTSPNLLNTSKSVNTPPRPMIVTRVIIQK